MGHREKYRAGHDFADAYLSIPESGSGPGVLILHAWWGLNAFFMKLCDRFAQEGFVALAPDLYHGGTATTVEEAKNLRSSVDRKIANLEMMVAVDHLVSLGSVTHPKVSVIGFSLGANYANWLAINKPEDIQSVILFYGKGGGKFKKTAAAYLGHFAETDRYGAGPDKIAVFKDRLLAAGRAVIFYTYKDTKHWFFESDRPDVYHPEAAKLAWERTVRFLRDQYP